MSNNLVNRLANSFGAPTHTHNPAGFLEEIVRITQAFEPQVLDRAADKLIAMHVPTQRRPWPMPNEIVNACVEARRWMPDLNKTTERNLEWTAEARAKAFDIIRSPMGRRAAEEGWVLSMWDTARKTGRALTASEIARCKEIAVEFDQAYAACIKNPTELNRSLLKLGDSMIERRKRYARHARGETIEPDNFKPRFMADMTRRITGEAFDAMEELDD